MERKVIKNFRKFLNIYIKLILFAYLLKYDHFSFYKKKNEKEFIP